MFILITVSYTIFTVVKCDNVTEVNVTKINVTSNDTNVTDTPNIIEPVNITEVLTICEMVETLLSILDINSVNTNSDRIKELKEKLDKINQYVIDKDKYMEIIINETKDFNLNETNFYNALIDEDHFQKISNESMNLYLKLKSKMTRDDIMHILANRSEGMLQKSARRMINNEFMPRRKSEWVVDEVVDDMLGEAPNDQHKFNASHRYSKYWDPQVELEERQRFHKKDGRRIFRGERTTVRYYPFMVSVHVMGRFWCGGIIYWHDIVLTSASCLQLMHNNRFFRENPRVLQVRVGSNHSRIGGELVEAIEVYFHPAYNPRTLRNNIAIIRLRRHLSFNYHRIPKIIEISHLPTSVSATAEVLLLGWGVTKTSQKMAYEPIYLQRKFLPVYPNMFCKEVYGDKFITDTMFCAGTFTTGEGACDHDAGGPAVLSGKLVGIISFGPTICGFPNAPTVFTLVGAYADWIETVNETMPGYYRGRARTTTTTEYPYRYLFTTTTPSTTHRIQIPVEQTVRRTTTELTVDPDYRVEGEKITTPGATTEEPAELATLNLTGTPMFRKKKKRPFKQVKGLDIEYKRRA